MSRDRLKNGVILWATKHHYRMKNCQIPNHFLFRWKTKYYYSIVIAVARAHTMSCRKKSERERTKKQTAQLFIVYAKNEEKNIIFFVVVCRRFRCIIICYNNNRFFNSMSPNFAERSRRGTNKMLSLFSTHSASAWREWSTVFGVNEFIIIICVCNECTTYQLNLLCISMREYKCVLSYFGVSRLSISRSNLVTGVKSCTHVRDNRHRRAEKYEVILHISHLIPFHLRV